MTDPKVARLKTYEECKAFIQNVEAEYPELARQAIRHGVLLRAAAQGATTEVEREAVQVVFALQEAKSIARGKSVRATRTWNSFKANGIVATVEKIVSKKVATSGYEALVECGLGEFTFEAVVLRHTDCFTDQAVQMAKSRIDQLTQ